MKKGVLKNFANFTENHLCWSLFLIKLQAFSLTALLKRDSNTDIFCEICEIFKNTYFEGHLRTTASKLLFREKPHWLIKIRCFLILQICSIKTEAVAWRCSVKMMFLKISQIHKKAAVSESSFEKNRRRRMINERLRHRYFSARFTKFLRTPILKNFREWLLTNPFYENKPPAPKT